MKTIAAIATPIGVGGLSVIRISGENATSIAEKVFKSNRNVADMLAYEACYGQIFDGDKLVDDGVLLIFKAPRSYTGEDVAEISCHGGLLVTQNVLKACLNAGATLATAGEFTKRALLNGKLSLTQAEAVMDVINAEGNQYLNAANAQMEGALYQKIEQATDALLGISSQIAAWVDYPDEETPPVDEVELLRDLRKVEDELVRLLATYDEGKLLRDGIDCAIVGKPNAGKSTLMNVISGTQKSIVTDIAGTTRDIVEEVVTIDGVILRLADCAGIRETDDPVEKIGVERMKKRLAQSQLAIAVFDASRALNSDDYELIDSLKGKTAIAVINKTDLAIQADLAYIKKNISDCVEISAKNASNMDAFYTAVKQAVNLGKLDPSAGFLANERQRACAILAKEAVSEAILGVESGMTLDVAGLATERAIEQLMELSGKKASEEIITEVFKRFCVGK